MKYTKLGNSDLTVSRVCMGCMGFGDAAHGQHTWAVDEDTTREIVKHGFDLGNDKAFLVRVVSQCLPYIGYPRSLNAITCISKAAEG